jgi:hypothetical protein
MFSIKGPSTLAFFASVSPSARKAKEAVGQWRHRGRRNGRKKRECRRPLSCIQHEQKVVDQTHWQTLKRILRKCRYCLLRTAHVLFPLASFLHLHVPHIHGEDVQQVTVGVTVEPMLGITD